MREKNRLQEDKTAEVVELLARLLLEASVQPLQSPLKPPTDGLGAGWKFKAVEKPNAEGTQEKNRAK